MDALSIVARNGLWLLAPVMLWNALLARKLPRAYSPEEFGRDIPRAIALPENVFRLFLFALPAATVIDGWGSWRAHLAFLLGVGVYFSSWLALMRWPEGAWSRHRVGFLAPAYTPALWLSAMAWQTTSYLGHPTWVRIAFLSLGSVFLTFHIAHTDRVYRRLRAERAGDHPPTA